MDATSVSGEYKSGTYDEVKWYEGYNNVLLYEPSAIENDVLNFENLAELLSYGPQKRYVGITDDAGNKNRAASFIDLVRGKELMPYYNDFNKILEFLNIPENRADDVLDDAEEIAEAYQNGTGKYFYTIADLLIYADLDDDAEVPAKEYVRIYNAITGEDMSEEEFNLYVN